MSTGWTLPTPNNIGEGVTDEQVTIKVGDAWDLASTLTPQSVDCIVTSPPYWGLRDYGVDGQFGMEPTPEAYVARLVELFALLRPALRDDGTVWLNLGDSYSTHASGKCANPHATSGLAGIGTQVEARAKKEASESYRNSTLPEKNLVGIPWRVAFALQADGWYLRSDIIWHKPNPMPESVTDRPTKSHEYLFLLSKSPRYYYDHEAIKEPAVTTTVSKAGANGRDKQSGHGRRHAGFNGRYAERLKEEGVPTTRNKRDVWTVATRPYPGSHFAVFPPDLIRPCILAGCPEGGTVLDPFLGSGTTAEVARSLGRKCVGFELNPEYLPLIEGRLR